MNVEEVLAKLYRQILETLTTIGPGELLMKIGRDAEAKFGH